MPEVDILTTQQNCINRCWIIYH